MFHVKHFGEDDSTPLANELMAHSRRRKALDAVEYPHPAHTRVFTVTNQKGGVGKTTTTVNIAAALAHAGIPTLVIDLDPQGNASTALGVDDRHDHLSVYDVLLNGRSLHDVVVASPESSNLWCAPANLDLAGAEIELVSVPQREIRLAQAIREFLSSQGRHIEYIFIDCPPSLGLLTVNALSAAHEVLIPIQCEYYALEGLSQLLQNIDRITQHLNPLLRLTTILLTMYDARTRLAAEVAAQVRQYFPQETLGTVIPRAVRVSEAPSYGQSVVSYDPGSVGALAYREAALELAQRGRA